MELMSDWPPNNKHRFRRPRRVAAAGFMAFLGGCVVLGKLELPADVSVGSNIGPTPCDVTLAGQCARQLTTTTTRATSTTSTRPPTTVAYGPERPCNPGGTDILLVTDGKTYCVIRTVTTGQLAFALTTFAN